MARENRSTQRLRQVSADRKVRDRVALEMNVYEAARQRCATLLDDYEQVVVSFSGGKDSTAVLNVMLEVIHSDLDRWGHHLPLQAIFFDEEVIPTETVEYVQRVSERDDVALRWYCLPLSYRNACSSKEPFWYPWAPEARDKWVRELPEQAITEMEGFDFTEPSTRPKHSQMNPYLVDVRKSAALVLGIRAQESLRRQYVIMSRPAHNNWLSVDDQPGQATYTKAYPIYDWTTEDVWTAPAKLGWDYNRAYDRMEMMGISRTDQRCSPAFNEEPMKFLHKFAESNPELWGKVLERVPGVGAAYRYGKTELYGGGSRPHPAPPVTWQEHIVTYIKRYDGQFRETVRKRIESEIKKHYKKTSLPILSKAFCPDSGVSWDWLIHLVLRGDFYSRQVATMKQTMDPVGLARQWNSYIDELHALYIQFGNDREALAKFLGFPGKLPEDPLEYLPPEFRSTYEDRK